MNKVTKQERELDRKQRTLQVLHLTDLQKLKDWVDKQLEEGFTKVSTDVIECPYYGDLENITLTPYKTKKDGKWDW